MSGNWVIEAHKYGAWLKIFWRDSEEQAQKTLDRNRMFGMEYRIRNLDEDPDPVVARDAYEGKSWQELRDTIAEYESAIGFETNCTNCARMLDLQHDLEARMDRAKKLARRIESLQSDYTRLPGVNGDRVADLLSDDTYNLGHELRDVLGDL